MVRLALVASVACTRPPVSRHSSQVSIVPKASSPGFGARRARRSRCRAARPAWWRRNRGRAAARCVRVTSGLVPGLAQRVADGGGAAVLPDDGVVDRPAGGAVPQHGGLALVGDADGGNVGGAAAGRRQGLAQGLDAVRPNLRRRRARPSRKPGNAGQGRAEPRRPAPAAGRGKRWCGWRWCPGLERESGRVAWNDLPGRQHRRSRGRGQARRGQRLRPAKRSVNQPKKLCAPRRRAARSVSGPISAMASPVMSRSEAMAATRRRISFSQASSSMQK